jgi:hypothetical protein
VVGNILILREKLYFARNMQFSVAKEVFALPEIRLQNANQGIVRAKWLASAKIHTTSGKRRSPTRSIAAGSGN